jgi:hypothetical protein
MARPSQYSQARRFVMQVTMIVVLAGTLALAWFVAQSRAKAAIVELQPKPFFAGNLAIRLPKTWRVDQAGEAVPIKVTAEETETAKAGQRIAVVYQFPTVNKKADEFLRERLSDDVDQLGALRPFSFLGQAGVIARYQGLHPIENDAFGRSVKVPGWYAATIVPGAGPEGRDLGVILGLEGFGAAGPAGSRLMRQLADGMTLHGGGR